MVGDHPIARLAVDRPDSDQSSLGVVDKENARLDK